MSTFPTPYWCGFGGVARGGSFWCRHSGKTLRAGAKHHPRRFLRSSLCCPLYSVRTARERGGFWSCDMSRHLQTCALVVCSLGLPTQMGWGCCRQPPVSWKKNNKPNFQSVLFLGRASRSAHAHAWGSFRPQARRSAALHRWLGLPPLATCCSRNLRTVRCNAYTETAAARVLSKFEHFPLLAVEEAAATALERHERAVLPTPPQAPCSVFLLGKKKNTKHG